MTPDVSRNQISHSPTNIRSSSDSTNDSAKESNWLNRPLKATGLSLGGLAAVSLLNHYSPPSFGQSLLRYTISQVPALLYILGTTKIDPSLMRELNRDLESLILKEAGLPKDEMCAVKCVVWLNKPGDFPVFDKYRLDDAYQKIYCKNKNNFFAIFKYLNSNGWQCSEHYVTESTIINPNLAGEPSLVETPPVDSLNINEALLCFTIPKEENKEGIPHVCVVLRNSESKYTVYDPNASLLITKDDDQSCIKQLNKLADTQGNKFLWFTKAVPKK